jgi:hypothetical protein
MCCQNKRLAFTSYSIQTIPECSSCFWIHTTWKNNLNFKITSIGNRNLEKIKSYEVGSSNKTTLGDPTRAIATDNFLLLPPLSV